MKLHRGYEFIIDWTKLFSFVYSRGIIEPRETIDRLYITLVVVDCIGHVVNQLLH